MQWDITDTVISIHALLAESDLAVADLSKRDVRFLSTLSLRRATPVYYVCRHRSGISIHALLAESDTNPRSRLRQLCNFYPRSPCGERPQWRTLASGMYDFYPRSPCGERLTMIILTGGRFIFLSTLSLRRATQCPPHHGYRLKFLSTLSLRRATTPCSNGFHNI